MKKMESLKDKKFETLDSSQLSKLRGGLTTPLKTAVVTTCRGTGSDEADSGSEDDTWPF